MFLFKILIYSEIFILLLILLEQRTIFQILKFAAILLFPALFKSKYVA